MQARRFGLGLAALALGVTATTGLASAALAQTSPPCYPPNSAACPVTPESSANPSISPAASPSASPATSPAASPAASPVASPATSPAASPATSPAPETGPAGTPQVPGVGNLLETVGGLLPTAGAPLSVSSGAGTFDAGSSVEVGVQSVYTRLGTTTATASGAAAGTFTIPASLNDGNHNIVFSGLLNGQATKVSLPFTLNAAAAAAQVAAAGGTTLPLIGALPRTGSAEAVPIALSGIALVAVGAGLVVVARRRRSALEATSIA